MWLSCRHNQAVWQATKLGTPHTVSPMHASTVATFFQLYMCIYLEVVRVGNWLVQIRARIYLSTFIDGPPPSRHARCFTQANLSIALVSSTKLHATHILHGCIYACLTANERCEEFLISELDPAMIWWRFHIGMTAECQPKLRPYWYFVTVTDDEDNHNLLCLCICSTYDARAPCILQ
jgi:hypothetical protein